MIASGKVGNNEFEQALQLYSFKQAMETARRIRAGNEVKSLSGFQAYPVFSLSVAALRKEVLLGKVVSSS
ncbi:hypothetical protein U1Q18_028414 [Sarracenia purpurea var. burkii]